MIKVGCKENKTKQSKAKKESKEIHLWLPPWGNPCEATHVDQDWRKEDSEWQHEYAYPEIEWQVLMVYEGKVQLKDACTLHLRGSAGIIDF